MNRRMDWPGSQRGFNFLEVIIGVGIFAIGMLAIASLQGALSRSTAEAQVRTVGVNIAERVIEERRGFSRLSVGSTAGIDYQEIVDVTDGSLDEDHHGVHYDVTVDVTDWYYSPATDSFQDTAPSGVSVSDYKSIAVTVAWDDTREFRVSDGVTVQNSAVGAGDIVLSATIARTSNPAAGRLALEGVGFPGAPDVAYDPGQNPDVVSLSLGDNKFKESTLPEPDVIRRDEYVETRWDVITYSNVNGNALFLRREEFIAVSCECTLRSASASQLGRRPVVWAGDEYEGGHFVEKQYGEVANNQQSPFCDECCRDHHDGGTGTDDFSDGNLNVYDAFNAPSSGNHNHYRYQGGSLLTASVGQNYLEVCRMVRDEGFFRVAQDLRQADLNVFPGDFLDDDSEVDTYSAYVTHVADQYDIAVGDTNYVSAPPVIKSADAACEDEGKEGEICPPAYGGAYPTAAADGEFPSWAAVNRSAGQTEQMRSRGLYIDYISTDLRNVVDCIRADAASPETQSGCSEVDGYLKSGDVVLDRTGSHNVLELLPFFEVQLTFLNKWLPDPMPGPLSVTNQALADHNAHSRGVLSGNSLGTADLDVKSWTGNLALTDTVVHKPSLVPAVAEMDLCAHDSTGAGCGVAPPSPVGPVITGNISESVPGNPAWSVSGSGGQTSCSLTPSGFTCTIDPTASNPRLTITGYGKANTNRWACSVGAGTLSPTGLGSPTGATATEVFSLSGITSDGSGYDVHIQQGSSC